MNPIKFPEFYKYVIGFIFILNEISFTIEIDNHNACGLRSPKGNPDTINSENVNTIDYPWQVGIYRNTKEFQCAGTLIDENIILSVAHCFTDFQGNKNPVQNYVVAAGKYYSEYDDARDKFAQYSTVREIFIPERYKGTVGLQSLDIAVLILQNSFTMTVAVQPVCIELNEESENTDYMINNNGTVMGWSYTQLKQNMPDVLKELIVPYIPYAKCYSEVPISFRQYITPDKICAGYLNQGISACSQATSGSSLVYNINNHYYIKGILSVTPTTDGECDLNLYSLYTSVYKHINFIKQILTDHGAKQSVECMGDDCTNEDTGKRS